MTEKSTAETQKFEDPGQALEKHLNPTQAEEALKKINEKPGLAKSAATAWVNAVNGGKLRFLKNPAVLWTVVIASQFISLPTLLIHGFPRAKLFFTGTDHLDKQIADLKKEKDELTQKLTVVNKELEVAKATPGKPWDSQRDVMLRLVDVAKGRQAFTTPVNWLTRQTAAELEISLSVAGDAGLKPIIGPPLTEEELKGKPIVLDSVGEKNKDNKQAFMDEALLQKPELRQAVIAGVNLIRKDIGKSEVQAEKRDIAYRFDLVAGGKKLKITRDPGADGGTDMTAIGEVDIPAPAPGS